MECQQAVLPNEKHDFSAGLASCTQGRAGRLHYRTGQWAAQYAGLWKRVGRRAAFVCNPPRPFSQPAGSPICLLCSLPAVHIFLLETRPSSPPSPPISVMHKKTLNSQKNTRLQKQTYAQ